MEYVFKIVLKAHVYLILITLISYIVEKITGLLLLVNAFSQEKIDSEDARGNTHLFTLLYFVFLLLFLLYDVYFKNGATVDYAFWKWLIVVFPLTILFWKVYHKYQGREPEVRNNK